ncbi:hypothetical protein DV713_06930 [Parageobacillus thermoglucosidasius]|nr:hypothetical protein [Parageobacillus thermoglucosidasius]RDE33857.1 hypothetical protein DV713_06930 [Parageobacillus thermoglucosidasius]GCD83938.1 hypothetical protein PTHTG4_30030 [Parageobacillus thermoglucosidasius]
MADQKMLQDDENNSEVAHLKKWQFGREAKKDGVVQGKNRRKKQLSYFTACVKTCPMIVGLLCNRYQFCVADIVPVLR